MQANTILEISTLKDHAVGCPGLTAALAEVFVESAAVCLEENSHSQGIMMKVAGDLACAYELRWPSADQKTRNAHKDSEEAVEWGATCIALHLVRDLHGLKVSERARKGGGFDYWLCDQNQTPDLFQNSTRLEVSGILKEEENNFRARIKKKTTQISKSSGTPGYVVVVGFNVPQAYLKAQ